MAPQQADQQGMNLRQQTGVSPACQPSPQGRPADLRRCRGQAAPGCALAQEPPHGRQHPDRVGGRVAATALPGRSVEVLTLRHDTRAAIRLVETTRLPNPDPPHKFATDPSPRGQTKQ